MSNERKRILLVMPPEAQSEVMRALPDPEVRFCLAGDCEQVRELYRAGERAATEADLVIVALTLGDGNWLTVYRELATRSAPADVIVALPEGAGNPAPLADFGVAAVIRPPYDDARCREAILKALERKHAVAH